MWWRRTSGAAWSDRGPNSKGIGGRRETPDGLRRTTPSGLDFRKRRAGSIPLSGERKFGARANFSLDPRVQVGRARPSSTWLARSELCNREVAGFFLTGPTEIRPGIFFLRRARQTARDLGRPLVTPKPPPSGRTACAGACEALWRDWAGAAEAAWPPG